MIRLLKVCNHRRVRLFIHSGFTSCVSSLRFRSMLASVQRVKEFRRQDGSVLNRRETLDLLERLLKVQHRLSLNVVSVVAALSDQLLNLLA